MLWVDDSIHVLSGMAGLGGLGAWGPHLCVSILVSWLSVVKGKMSPGLVGSSSILAVCPGQVAFFLWTSVSLL